VRRRVIIILFFPVFAALFLVGWVLFVLGDSHASNKVANERRTVDIVLEEESTTNVDGVEMGLIEGIAEEQLAD